MDITCMPGMYQCGAFNSDSEDETAPPALHYAAGADSGKHLYLLHLQQVNDPKDDYSKGEDEDEDEEQETLLSDDLDDADSPGAEIPLPHSDYKVAPYTAFDDTVADDNYNMQWLPCYQH